MSTPNGCLPLHSVATTGRPLSQPPPTTTPLKQERKSRVKEDSPVPRRRLTDVPRLIVEDFPTGYPQFTALLSTHPYFHIFRKFSHLRTRSLLNKQDELVRLEEQLQELDEGDTCPLFRGSFRKDRNTRRSQLFGEINRHLADYGKYDFCATSRTPCVLMCDSNQLTKPDDLVERTERALKRPAAMERDIVNVQNWIQTTGQIPKEEATYLWSSDLTALGVSGHDPTYSILEGPIEDAIIWASDKMSKACLRKAISQNPHVYVFSQSAIEGIARVLMAILLLALLFVPIAVSLSVESVGLRVFAAFCACSAFILAMSIVTKAKTAELFVAGATYSALLVVFITNSN